MTQERDRAAKGRIGFDLQSVEPGDFATLTYLLARTEHPDVVIVRNKDRGLDARLPDPVVRTTLRGWQAKRFAQSGIHWGQCQKSLDDAIVFWRPLRVTRQSNSASPKSRARGLTYRSVRMAATP